MNINDDILYKIDSEIGKDKKVVELQREIERLNQEIRCLNNCIIEFHSEFCNKQAEINRLNNIINELEHDFESYELEYLQDTYQGSLADFIETELERIQELKGSDKSEKD